MGIVLLLVVAAIGGFLLNLTPCVLPVIPIKIIGLSNAAGNRAKCLMLGIWMSVGVIGFWFVLGGVIASISQVKAVSVLFQYAWFTIAIGIVIAVMAVGMCGLFAIRLPQWVYRISPKQETAGGSIGFGVMTAILSTPCTAPFMGAAAAWALTQNMIIVLMTFGSIGAGMALPYLVLSASPHLVEKMPRTGPGSELIKQVMGLLMLAAAAYFVGVGVSSLMATPPDSPSQAYWWFVMGFIGLAGLWLIIKTWKITGNSVKRGVWTAVGVLAIASSTYGGAALTKEGPIDWVNYTPERLEKSLSEGKVVVLDFTAEWCLNCKTLENTVLSSEGVVRILEENDVVPMKVDLTSKENYAGWNKLSEVGRATIPLLIVYSPDGSEKLKSDWYTADQVIEAVKSAK